MSASAEFDARLAELRQRFIDRLVDRLATIAAAWQSIQTGSDSAQARSTLFHQVHSLAGSGATFGFEALSRAARALEPLMDPHLVPPDVGLDAGQIADINRMLGDLLREAQLVNPVARM